MLRLVRSMEGVLNTRANHSDRPAEDVDKLPRCRAKGMSNFRSCTSGLLCPTLELVFGAVRSKLLHELVIEAQNQECWRPLAYEQGVFVPPD